MPVKPPPRNLRFNERRFNKVAVFASRPMTCSTAANLHFFGKRLSDAFDETLFTRTKTSTFTFSFSLFLLLSDDRAFNSFGILRRFLQFRRIEAEFFDAAQNILVSRVRHFRRAA